jgi:alpha-ketoglutarate-dependent 2,4-dichlorophenoxyacetate dioxygenase
MAEDQLAAVTAAFEERSVVVFRDADLTDDGQIAFTEQFGPLEPTLVGTKGDGGYFAKLNNVNDDGSLTDPEEQNQLFNKANGFWHTDSSFKPVPAKASLLLARVIPPEGGDTEFANFRLAYDALPEETKRRIEHFTCEHDLARTREMISPGAMTQKQRDAYPPVRHAMVRTNPANGRKNLFIGAHVTRILELPEDESRALLDELQDFGTQPRFIYRHKWRVHDLVMWDNRCMLHRATGFDARRYPRVMQRTTLLGDGPTIAAAA